jgi:hypothetical protein
MTEPRRKDTIEDFSAALIRSKLATERNVAILIERYRFEFLPTTNLPDTISAFCNFLVIQQVLTPWQIDKLRHAKWKGFFLDDYVFFDQLGLDSEYCYYLARHTGTGKFARLAITPFHRSNGPGIEYRVDYEWD